MHFPLIKIPLITRAPDSFKNVDFTTHTEIPTGNLHPGAFGAIRKNHIHEGVDLYALEGDTVFAMESGVVVSKGPFTGPKAGFPWWRDTDFVMIEGVSGVLCYGEIAVLSNIEVGQAIEEGQAIGEIVQVLVKDKGRPMHMLHLEHYRKGVTVSCGVWPLHSEIPEGLQDPTELLIQAARLPIE